MRLSFITVDGIRLAYLEKNPKSEKIIFFIHGNSSSSNTWAAQFESELLSGYRLIAFDLPAHGQSSISNDYSLPGLGRLLSTAVGQLAGGQDYILCGVSLGVNIVSEMVGGAMGVPRGIMTIGSCALGGECTMEVVFRPGVDMRPSLEDDVSAEELRQYWTLAGLSVQDVCGEAYRLFEEDYFMVRDNFRSKMFAMVAAGRIGDEIALLRESGIPVLTVFGEEEKVCNINYLDQAGLRLWENKVFKLPGAGHFAHIDLPETINELIGVFANDVFK